MNRGPFDRLPPTRRASDDFSPPLGLRPSADRHASPGGRAPAAVPAAASAEVTAGPSRRLSLLVSVRDAEEADAALAVGVDLLDVKEPSRGPLAAADPATWRQIAARWRHRFGEAALRPGETALRPGNTALQPGNTALSAALGEADQAVAAAADLPGDYAFAKAGPGGCGSGRALADAWDAVRAALPETTSLVAVAYADDEAAGCPPPERVFELAAGRDIRWCLVDTFVKDGRGLTDHLSPRRLAALVDAARGRGQWVALAGSIVLRSARTLLRDGIRPDCFGVRGDVCPGGRRQGLSPARVAAWRDACRLIDGHCDGAETSQDLAAGRSPFLPRDASEARG